MATRFYLTKPATTVPISPTPAGGWEDTSILARSLMWKTPIGAAMDTLTFTDADDTDKDVLFRQFISYSPLAAGQTVTGAQAIKAQLLVKEGAGVNNMYLTLGIRIIASDGSTVQKTVLTITRDNVEAATTLTNRQFTATSIAGNYTTVSGDYLVVEVGMGGDPAVTFSHGSQISLGDDAASDLPEDDTTTTNLRPWVQLTDTLTFGYVLDASPGAYTLTGTAAQIGAARNFNVAPGSYALTGAAVAFQKGYQLLAAAGSYVLTGISALLTAAVEIVPVLISPRDQNKEFSNVGAVSTYRYTFPAAVRGQRWGPFVVTAAQPLRLDPNGTEVFTVSFTDADATSPVGSVAHSDLAAGKYLGCSTPGARISFRCDVTGKLKAVEKIGAWAKEA